MHNHSTRTKPIIIGFLLCLFSTSTLVSFSVVFYHTWLHNILQELQDKTAHFTLVEKIYAQSHAAQIVMMRYRETNDPKCVELFRDRVDNIQEISDKIPSAARPLVIAVSEEIFILLDKLYGLLQDDILIGERLAQEETPKLLAHRQKIRDDQYQLMAEIEDRFAYFTDKQEDGFTSDWEFSLRRHSHYYGLIIAASVIIVVFNVIVCFVVVRLVGSNVAASDVSPSDWDNVSPPGGSQDMRIVADRLQEVVNLLRR